MKTVLLLAYALMLGLSILALSTHARASNDLQTGKGTLLSAPSDACTAGAIAPSPNVLGRNELSAVDAISSNDVWAVGNYYTPTLGATLAMAEHFDGSAWSVVPIPRTAFRETHLSAISGLSANDVWAVGYSYENGATMLAMHWNGSVWSLSPTPNPAPSYGGHALYGVIAISTNDVWAVGYYSVDGSTHALAIHWDGIRWTQISIASDPTYPLYAVTALSATDVWAVGDGTNVSGSPLILHWDGSTWRDFSGEGRGVLVSVDAVSASDVWAVGNTGRSYSNPDQTLVMHWNGTEWSVVPSPGNMTGVSLLNGVSAITSNNVWAVGSTASGYYSDYPTSQTLIEHWDGSEWRIVANPSASLGKLYSVDALSATSVWAVGGHGNPLTLAEHWDGAGWSVIATPNPGLASNRLNSVDALSPTDVWAVGSYDYYAPPLTNNYTLIQHWDGTAWSIVPSPNGDRPENTLTSVEAITPDDVWAVGISGDGGDFVSLTLHWDGVRWSVVPSPNPGVRPKYLQGVSAVSANDVWAVGFLFDSGPGLPSRTFIIHWNGSAWSLVQSPNVGMGANLLYGVAAVSGNDAWAVGYYDDDPFDMHHPLLLHWDGSQWTQTPGPAIASVALSSVSAVSSNDVWAVGTDYISETSGRTLTMHWDGSAWSVVPSPNFGTSVNQLTSVSAVSSGNVWAAGGFEGGTLIEHWDGAQWSIAYIATPGLLDNYLLGVSALSESDVWAVGLYSDGEPAHTLVEHIGRFNDVVPGDYFFTPVNYLATQGAIGGYDDCTFHPGNTATRGQLSKIVTLAQGWTLLDPASPTFADVARGSTFYQYVETIFSHGVIGGYPCGEPGEPCDGQNRPYFRPNADVTRGQITKIVVLSKGWALQDPATATFADVERDSAFYTYIETASAHGVINGYGCGGSNEPCDVQNRPYFRPSNSATRGQIAKIVYRAVTAP